MCSGSAAAGIHPSACPGVMAEVCSLLCSLTSAFSSVVCTHLQETVELSSMSYVPMPRIGEVCPLLLIWFVPSNQSY